MEDYSPKIDFSNLELLEPQNSIQSAEGEKKEKKVTLCIYDSNSVKSGIVEWIFFVIIILIIFTILILCILYFTVNSGPSNLGSTLCCSPASMYVGQRLENGLWLLKMESSGNLSLYKNDPMADPPVSLIWSTPTSGQNISRAIINTN